MSSLARGRRIIEARYGFPFPDDLYAFHDFVRSHPKVGEALEIVIDGPLALLADAKAPIERYYNDPPEFFTVLGGLIDGLHWGYWFDDPGKSAPIVASFYANDAFEIAIEGMTLFEAVREHLEAFHRDASEYEKDDPDYADDYRRRFERYASVRDALAQYSELLRKRTEIGDEYLDKYVFTTKPLTKRRPAAPTRSKIGIVVPRTRYRAIGKKDPFQVWNYEPKAADVKRFTKAARDATQDGFPGTALKLGHDLWIYREHRASSYEMLELAYAELGREILHRQLASAIAHRKRCDERAETR